MAKTIRQFLWIATILGSLILPLTGVTAENDRFAQMILFIPSDAEPPDSYQPRMNSLALRAEAFFANSMKHWKRPIEREQIFARNEDGTVKVTLVKGDLLNPKGRATLPEIRKKAVEAASKKLNLKRNGTPVIWWIFYDYPSVKGFQGGARADGSGIAINAYPKGSELIDVDTDLAEGALAEMAIKGTIHEFGHALGLPHIGPRPALKLGNSLMGPINNAYWKKANTDDTRVYLNEASASALWKHPIFKGQPTPKLVMPTSVQVENLKVSESEDKQSIVIQGKLRSDLSAHTAVILDSDRGKFGDYWARSYTGAINPETSTFKIMITEPYEKGTLFLSFNFGNGINTSDGKKIFQQGCSVSIPYSTKQGARAFQN